MSELALLEIDSAVATLKLNRPESRNALSVELLAALHDRVGELEKLGGGAPTVLVMTTGLVLLASPLALMLKEQERMGNR